MVIFGCWFLHYGNGKTSLYILRDNKINTLSFCLQVNWVKQSLTKMLYLSLIVYTIYEPPININYEQGSLLIKFYIKRFCFCGISSVQFWYRIEYSWVAFLLASLNYFATVTFVRTKYFLPFHTLRIKLKEICDFSPPVKINVSKIHKWNKI